MIEKKKPREEKSGLLSASALTGIGTSTMLQSSLLGNKGSSLATQSRSGSALVTKTRSGYAGESYTSGSSLLSGSFGSSLKSTELKKSSLTSGLLSSAGAGSLGSGSSLTSSISARKAKSMESKSLFLSSSLLQPSLGTSSLSSASKLLGSGLTPSMSRPSQSHVAMGTGFAGGLSMKSDLLTSRQDSKESQERKMRKDKPTKTRKRVRVGGHEAEAPMYNLAAEIKNEKEIEIPKFVPPEKDPSLILTGARLHDVNGMKVLCRFY